MKMSRKERYHKAKLENNKPVLHCRFGRNKPWVDITYTRFDVEKLKFIDTNDKEHGYLDCKSELIGLIFKLFLSFVCSKILYDGLVVWSFKFHFWSGHPLNICLDLLENVFHLNFTNNHKVHLNIIPKPDSTHSNHCCNTINNCNINTNNINNNNINNCNINSNTIKGCNGNLRNNDRRIMVAIFKTQKVDEIFYNTEQVWDRQPNEPYPVKYISNEETMEFVVIFENNFKVCTNVNGQWVSTLQDITKELREIIDSLDIQNSPSPII